jgi:starvation-inducible DNA-binding protein
MAKVETAKTYLSLDEESLQPVIMALQTTLANTMFMQQLYKKYHWHVAGEDFYQYHLLFDKHAAEQLPIIDALAERMRTLGGTVAAMPADIVKYASLKEGADVGHKPQDMVDSLLAAHQSYLEQLHEAVTIADDADDEGTEDLLVSEALRVHELELWFLRSSIG